MPAALVSDSPALPATLFQVQGVPGPPGVLPPGSFAEVELEDGSTVLVPLLPVLAVAQGATTPALGADQRGLAWSSVLEGVAVWNGTAWVRALGGGTVEPEPTEGVLVNAAGETLTNDLGEEVVLG